MTDEATIRRSTIRLTRCCRSALMYFHTDTDRTSCVCGQMDPTTFTPWYSPDGRQMFELVSDVTAPARPFGTADTDLPPPPASAGR